ncbi:hypothetical protein M569_05571, partial [Genlisea aurea]
YSHSMGNSTGNIDEYWEAIDSTFGLQGGFIWDWADQGLLKEGADGKKHWAYGGDFGDHPNDRNFCLNGLLWPDRTPHPALHEVKFVYSPVKITLENGAVKVKNAYFFDTTEGLKFRWRIHGDGVELSSGILNLPRIDPQGAYDMALEASPWYDAYHSCDDAGEIFVTITAELSRSLRWAEAGHIVSSTQLQLPTPTPPLRRHMIFDGDDDGTLSLEDDENSITISDRSRLWEIKFNKEDGGGIEYWKVDGVDVMRSGFLPCFWRAPTDNDRGGESRSYFSQWTEAKLNDLKLITESFKVLQKSEKLVEVSAVHLLLPNNNGGESVVYFKAEFVYSISASGDVVLDCLIKPETATDVFRLLPGLPRVGIVFRLDESLNRIKWYGRGPFECYPDRRAAAHVGSYEGDVESLHVPYTMPGECGGRCDVRWATFEDGDGNGIYASVHGGSPPMQMNASRFGTAELERATHDEDLVKRDCIEVHLDHKHMGVGGDDSWSPCVHDKYLVPPLPYSFAIRFSPLSRPNSGHTLYKSQL